MGLAVRVLLLVPGLDDAPGVAAALVWAAAVALGCSAWRRLSSLRAGYRAAQETPHESSVAPRTAEGAGSSIVRWRWRAVEVVTHLGVPLLLMWPTVLHPFDRWVGTFDAPYSAWLGWRFGELIADGSVIPLTISDAVHPVGVDTLLLDGYLPAYVNGLFNLVAGPFSSYNLTVFVGLVADVAAGYALGRVLTRRRGIALLSGVAFVSAPVVASAVNAHVTFLWAFAVPLIVAESIRVARGDRELRWWVFGLLLVLAFLCSVYHAVFGALAGALVLALWPRSVARRRGTLWRGLGAVGFAALLLLPCGIARLRFDAAEAAAGAENDRVSDALLFAGDGLSAIVPPDEVLIDIPLPTPDLGVVAFPELGTPFVGFLLIAGLGLAATERARGSGALGLTAMVLWVLSLGPTLRVAGHTVVSQDGEPVLWMPFRLLSVIPGMSNFRAPDRAGFALAAVLTAMLVIGVASLLHRHDSRREAQVVISAAVALALPGLFIPAPESDLAVTTEVQEALDVVAERGAEGEAVMVVPWGCRVDDPRVIALQIRHRQPSLGCSVSTAAMPWYSELDVWVDSQELAALSCDPSSIGGRDTGYSIEEPPVLDDDGLRRLREDLGVRFVIVDTGALAAAAGCDHVAAGVDLLVQGEVLADDAGVVVIDLQDL
ncbi:MAG: hypothetical protein JJLCMIEE_00680 [Acidimicrobiales bacterium]|nr:hypothetical protein [Acidimicrobiales bacterium]